MGTCYLNGDENAAITETHSNISSPEMFDSDVESELNKKNNVNPIEEASSMASDMKEPTPTELVAKSDHCLLSRINKFLSGVPPPPKHTICRRDCSEFLLHIYQNPHLFWTPYEVLDKKDLEQESIKKSPKQINIENVNKNNCYQHSRTGLRNLTNAFDACDPSSETSSKELNVKSNCDDSNNFKAESNVNNDTENTISLSNNAIKVSNSILNTTQIRVDANENKTKQTLPNKLLQEEHSLLFYNTSNEKEAATLTWPDVYHHKFHGIHYNRNKAIEEFENLTIKLCERYIGAETQSTCNVWFTKQAPGSARKRSLLAKRDNGQSPGKRLSHLAKRRRTFSSANLQGLGLTDKKQFVLNVKKPVNKKGRTPRGKSPRGKSPRGKSPRSSAKKKVVRRLTLEGPSPRKSKLETSKRALFQSPPTDRAGPSKTLTGTGTNPHKIKRALFPTPKKKENESEDIKKVGESRKRKSEEELEGPRFKWAKSLSFDCTHELENKSIGTWSQERHSTSNILTKSDTSFSQERNELSDTHRKKLLWAVAEALRSKGIGMGHPQFKQYASNLARTIKKFMPDLENRNIPRKPGSTSDRMLKLAKHHVLFVIDARSTN